MEKEYQYMVATRCWTYNHSAYVKDALRGFAMQRTEYPIVFTIVDDASTDGTREILEEWAGDNLECKGELLWRNEPYGKVAFAKLKGNCNTFFVIVLLDENHHQTGRRALKMKYIAEWLDNAKYHSLCEGDDYWTNPLKLQMQVDFLENNNEYGMAYTAYQELNEVKGTLVPVCTKPSMKHDDSFKWRILEQKVMIGTCTVLIRSELEREIKAIEDDFKGFLLGDTQTWFNAARLYKVHYINEVTGVYRKVATGMTATFVPERRAKFIKSCLDAHLHLAYKYGAPLSTIKTIKKRFGGYAMRLYLEQGNYEEARRINSGVFNESGILSLIISFAEKMKLKKLTGLSKLVIVLSNMRLINLA